MRKLEIRTFLGLILTVLLVFAPFPGGLAFADNTTTLTATADATINQASATTNNGNATTINGAAPLTTAKQRALVKFDVSSIPAAIKAAYLKMTLTSTGAPAPSASTQAVHTVTGATLWTEGAGGANDVTWNNRTTGTAWTTAGGDYVATAINSQSSGTTNSATITWPVYTDGANNNIVQLWRTGALVNNGLLIKDDTELGNPLTATAVLAETFTSGNKNSFTTTGTLPTSYGLYIAAISKGGTVAGVISDVTSVTGGGLTWANVGRQDNTSTTNYGTVEVWYAIGTPTATTVTANFPRVKQAASIVITRFTGFDPNSGSTFGTAVGAATVSGAVGTAATVNLTTTAANSFAYGAVFAAGVTVTPGTSFTEDGEIGSANSADVEVEHLLIASPGINAVAATLAGAGAAWAILAVEIKQQVAPQYNSKENAGTKPQLEVHYIADATSPTATSTVPSQVNLGWTMPTGGTYINTSGTLIVKRPGASATTFTPTDANSSYTAGTTTGDGTSVLYRTDWTTGFTDENGADSVLAPSTQYTYKAWVRDDTTISGFGTAPYYAVGTAGFSATTPAAGSGTTRNWSYKTGAATLAPPSLNPNTGVIAGSNDNKVHSMSASTGVRNYQPAGSTGITGGAIQSRAAVIPQGVTSLTSCSCDVVYVGANDGKVYAFNAATGANLWTSVLLTNAGGFIQGGPAVQLKAYSNGSYARTTDLVVVGTRNLSDTTGNSIWGLDGNTGAKVWTFAPGTLDIINSTPWIDYNTNAAWVTSNAGSAGGQPSIWKLDTTTSNLAGNLLASITLSALSAANRHIDTSPTLNESAAAATFLYAVTKGNDLVAVDINPLSNLAYTTNVSGLATGGAGFPIPIVDGTTAGSDDLYFTLSGGSGGVYKYTFNRSSHGFTSGWSRTLAGASTPVFTPGAALAIYVGATDGLIHKLNPASGLDLDTRTANASATTGDPSFDVVANKIYIGATDGRIYSFDKF
jgi:hypothetical protein